MEFVTIGIVIGIALWTYFKMPKIPKVTMKPGEIEAPMCEDGAHIPVVFGTCCIKGANVTSWGGVSSMKAWSGEAEGQIIYALCMRMGLCHGPIDSVIKILIGGRDASASSGLGPITTDSRITLSAYQIVGGSALTGDVTGQLYFRMGAPDSILGNHSGVYSIMSDINGETGGLGPGFFGVACVELENVWVGGSPYLTPWAFVVQRIDKRNSASPSFGYTTQWYPERRYIPHGVTSETRWRIAQGDSLNVPYAPMNTWLTDNIPDDSDFSSSWLLPAGEGAAAPSGLPSIAGDDTKFGWEAGKHLWAKTVVWTDPTDAKYLGKIYLFVYCENAAWIWIDGQYVGTTNATNAAVNGASANFDVTELLKGGGVGGVAGFHNIVAYCLDEDPADDPGSTYFYARVVTSPVVDNNVDAATLYSFRDMNPAHIVRECLSDPVWGMGYADADIDDDSFEAVADTLYEERFGLSILWNEPGSIYDFINEILRHINGTLYVNPTTGKYVLSLIRDDYDADTILSLDDSTIERIEDVSRRSTGELINQVSVSYSSSIMGDDGTVTITEPGLVHSQGAVISSKIDYPGVTTHELASRLALRELKSLSSPLTSCTVIASRAAAVLNPGDPFKVTRTEYGLTNTVMRVASIERGDGRSDRVRIRCVEDVFSNPEESIIAPPSTPWSDPTATPVATPDPVFVDTYNYKSTFYVAKLADPAVMTRVDGVFCYFADATGLLPTIFNTRFPDNWEEIRTGVWRCKTAGQQILDLYTNGAGSFVGMRVIAAFISQSVDPDYDENTPCDLEAEDKPRTGIYVVTDCGARWDEETRQYVQTYATLERASDFLNGSQLENGCIVQIAKGARVGRTGTLDFTGKYARLTTTGAITVGTTALEWELLNSYSQVRGDNLLTEAQKEIYGDDIGDYLNLSATSAEPGVWVTFPTLTGTPNAATYPAGRTRWRFLAIFISGDTSATSTIECQLVKYVDNDHVTVLAEGESDPIVGGTEIFWNYYETHDDVNTDQALAGGRIAVRYRLTTTSASQVVVRFTYGDNIYSANVSTPLTLGQVSDFPHTPYGPVIELDGDGILVIPDMTTCSGEIRVSGAAFKGIQITDALGNAFVGGDKLSIRLTTNCYIHHNETVAAGAAGLNLSTAGGLTGTDCDKDVGPRSQIVLQYDDLVGQWEVIGQPTVMDKT